MRERIALLALPGEYWGAEEAGIAVIELPHAAALEATLRSLVAGGEHAILAVSAAAAAGREEEVEAIGDAAPPEVSVLTVPAPGQERLPALERLRRRFMAALGVDVWARAAERAGSGD